MTIRHAWVIGAGLSGLSAAVALRGGGVPVSILDSAAQAGGRCRSYHDPQLGQTIDNGNHLVLAGNEAVKRFLAAIDAPMRFSGPDRAEFAFCDTRSRERWTIRINDGRLPWWVLVSSRRLPGSKLADYLPIAQLLKMHDGPVHISKLAGNPVWERLIEPVLLAALNTAPAESSARLAATILRETIGKGGEASRPLIAHPSLGAAFIDPATAWLARNGSEIALGQRLKAIAFAEDRVTGLDWGQGIETVAKDEAVILAVPPWVATTLIPGLDAPDEMRAIVNGHFAFTPPADAPLMLGVIGGTAEWIFAFPERISITVSAADRLIDEDREALARLFWADICAAYGIDAPLPRWQIVKEKRATFAATPDQNAKRPGAATRWHNLFLAGDWTDTGLPATIEGALRSGETAARLALAS